VSALHEIPHGEAWPQDLILKRKDLINAAGLTWNVVESIPVHEDIKTREGRCNKLIEVYRQNLRRVAAAGIRTVCYNFMPVLDWTRTSLDHKMIDGSKALRFSWTDLAMFDIFILGRHSAVDDYSEEVVIAAQEKYSKGNKSFFARLSEIVLMGVPGEASIAPQDLKQSIHIYKEIGGDGLRDNLEWFQKQIMDTCEEEGIRMTIHPDDPPFDILGLPRIVSSRADLEHIIRKVDKPQNGICFCTGSLGAGAHNNLPEILRAVGHRVHFVHLRNTLREKDGSFIEAPHLEGDTDMYEIMRQLIKLQGQRDEPIPFRPDHGHQMLDDIHKETAPGYSAIGRLKGLAELRGLATAISRTV
ncbi:MAG: mannonate dehydratase, partial [Chitinophagaceae bacterium]